MFLAKRDYVRPLRRKSGMIIGARLDTTSRSRTANLVRVSRTTVSKVMKAYTNLDKVSSTKHKSGRNLKMKVGDRRVLKRLVPRKRKTAQPQCPKYNDNCHVLDESRSFFRVHTGYFSNIPKCINAEFIASWACSQSSVVSSSQR
ncbi:hypothetical protein TNCV_1544461 [Trichonephila clavipes]|nr:hypothetical protein TNCV_1544461 [Trichonephila clavipes]